MAGRGFWSRLIDALTGRSASSPAPLPPARPASPPPAATIAAKTEVPPTPPPVAMPVASPAVEAFVAEVKQLPLFSGTAMQLMKSVGDERTTTAELARLIGTDAGLVAHLLRIVNSPYYGLPRRLATVDDAIAVLGFDHVRRMISAAVMGRPLMTYLHDSRTVRAFWRHELLCAALARHLAARGGLDAEVAYMAGLMHEIGRLAMVIKHPHLGDVLLSVEGTRDRLGVEREMAHFGFDHAEVGGALLARWGLPPAIVRAAYHHEQAAQPADPLAAVVWRANLLAHDMNGEADDGTERPWMTAIGLTPDGRRRVEDEIAALEGNLG